MLMKPGLSRTPFRMCQLRGKQEEWRLCCGVLVSECSAQNAAIHQSFKTSTAGLGFADKCNQFVTDERASCFASCTIELSAAEQFFRILILLISFF